MKRARREAHPEMPKINKEFQNTQNKRTFVGIDNGVSGGITIMDEQECILLHEKTPVKKCLNYTKKKAFNNRIDFEKFKDMIAKAGSNTFVMIERPMINPGRWVASISAARCLEATEIILEQLQIPYQFVDSGEWQKVLLPSGLKGEELKVASNQVSKRLYPRQKIVNADCLLMSLHCKRKMSK